jgi:hypothetical protein
MTPLHSFERVLREQLGAADDRRDEHDRIKQGTDQL